MILEPSLIETIKKRRSVRTFDGRPITSADVEKINAYIANGEHAVGPFGGTTRFEYIPVTRGVSDKGLKLGTYGFIKNPKGYLAGITRNDPLALVEFGYAFERLVLYLTELEIGTCWLGGSFTRKSFEREISLGDGEFIPCITPVGYAKEKEHLLGAAIRYVAKADRRREWHELFYQGSFQSPLRMEEAGAFSVPIEMVRLGPSASNKQPWRLVLSDDKRTLHFYLEYTPNYRGNKLGFDMQRIDIGIAMCHFELACRELGIEGGWSVDNPGLAVQSERTEYVASYLERD